MNTHLVVLAGLVFLATGCETQSPMPSDPTVDGIVHGFATASRDSGDVQRVVDNAVGSKRSVMFVHVNWAMTAIYHRQYAEFVVQYHKKFPDDPLMFHFVDCSSVSRDYAPLRAIPGWQQLIDEAGTAMIHGNGEIAWIENGRVLRVQPIREFGTASALVEFTERLMPVSG